MRLPTSVWWGWVLSTLRRWQADQTMTPSGDDEEASSTPDGEDAPKEDPKTTSMPTAEYPPLPDRTATVAVWKEYARANGIKLTGLSKRAEIIGFVEKVAGRGE
ncbi:hypothetical protein I6I10_07020 [Corynebacterium glucuronolyticum]|uniref:Uncharacterized protein n=1 Tax=Corynebacterium glucuronolyticum TaxID=39791 RepID=A0A7T4ECJ3_9CORY|nr:hypothetical protein [Corynebacterium glucuronolyticum]QQB45293.1 hypothetical protein I6I10_07020 [Corynebacterium glucuronolyticum]